MPIYEYCCPDCKHEFAKRRSMSDADSPIACPECGGREARRGLSLFATVGGGASRAPVSTGSGCGSCRGGSCSTCRH